MKRTLIVLAIIIIALLNMKKENKEIVIPDNSIRFRIISNSNNKIDLETKLKLKDILEQEIYKLTKNSKTKEETEQIIVDNLNVFNKIIKTELNSNDYELNYGKNYFPAKVFKGVIYNSGYYDSLVVTIGTGKGSNWWCVLFPPLCLLEDNENTTDVEYKLFVSRIINNLK